MTSFIISLVAGMFFLSIASQGQIIVAKDGSGTFRSLREAIAAAGEYDEILVKPGEYVESIRVEQKKQLTITADGDVVLSPGANAYALSMVSCYKITLQGFKVNGVITLERCEDMGIIGCKVSAVNGGIAVTGSLGVRIFSNDLSKCGAFAIRVEGSRNTRIINNALYDNVATDGILVSKGDVKLMNNTIAYNRFTPVTIEAETKAEIINNIISFNMLPGETASITSRSKANNIVASFNNIYQNSNGAKTAPDYSGITPTSKLSEDPGFEDGKARNFVLKDTSPCYGSGKDGSSRFGSEISGMNLGADRLARFAPLVFEEQYEEGLDQFKRRRYDQSIQTLKRLLQHYPRNAEVWLALSNSYIGAGKLSDGIVACKTVLKIRPGDGVANYNLACVHSLMGQQSEAIKYLELALKSDTAFPDMPYDPNLDPIRQTQGFKKLVDMYDIR